MSISVLPICYDVGTHVLEFLELVDILAINDFCRRSRLCKRPEILDALSAMCRGGLTEHVRFLIQTYNITQEDMTEDIVLQCFYVPLNCGLTEIVNLLVEALQIDRESITSGAIGMGFWVGAFGKGHLQLAQWLVRKFFPEETSEMHRQAFGEACAGSLELVRWLDSAYHFDVEDVQRHHGIARACAREDSEIVEWLVRRFNISMEDMKRSNALGRACLGANGHSLQTVQWLVDTFPYTRDDILKPFWHTCVNGYKDIAQWLATKFNLTRKTAGLEFDKSYKQAHANSVAFQSYLDQNKIAFQSYLNQNSQLLETVQWLEDEFGFTEADRDDTLSSLTYG